MSDQLIPLLKEELQRLHQLIAKPEDAPGKGGKRCGNKDWARERITKIHQVLCGHVQLAMNPPITLRDSDLIK
jgi:hypothetical protein